MSRRVIRPQDDEWPQLLNEMSPLHPPKQLEAIGRPLPQQPLMAVVGSRRPTAAGLDAARILTKGLVEAGFGIVSGLAAGIDAAAHEAALDANGYTVAVLGFGLDVVYPRRNRRLKDRIAHEGTLITEYEDGTPPLAHHFPERNRIIAGMAQGTVVIEGATRSGALITARLALDANRHVFAVPGSFRNVMAAGSNELIRRCQAVLVTEVSHIFDELAAETAWDQPPRLSLEPAPIELSPDESSILGLLDDVPVSPDRLCEELGLTVGAVSLALARLEVRGLTIRRAAGIEISTAGARARAARPIGSAM